MRVLVRLPLNAVWPGLSLLKPGMIQIEMVTILAYVRPTSIRVFFMRWPYLLKFQLLLAFHDLIELVGFDIVDYLLQAAGPAISTILMRVALPSPKFARRSLCES